MRRLLKPLLFAGLALVAQPALCKDSSDGLPVDNGACPSGARTLLTGTHSGYYSRVGKAIAKVAEEQCQKASGSPCLRICAIENEQTLANIQKLASKQVDFAIVQGDVAHDAWYGHPLPLGKTLSGGKRENIPVEGVQDVKLVTPLYVEAVHILLRPHLNITNLGELRGLKVWLGQPGSSTEYTATRVLRGAGFSLGNCEPVEHKYEETDALVVTCVENKLDFLGEVGQLKPGGLDALFKIGPVPTSDIEDVLLGDSAGPETDPKKPDYQKSDYQLLPVDYDLARKFVQDRSYVYRLIQARDYEQGQSTLTIGVPALLLTNLGKNDEDVSRLARLVRENGSKIEDLVAQEKSTAGHPQLLRLDLLNVAVPVKTSSFVHEMAKPYLYQWWKDWRSHLILVALVAAFVVLCFLVAWLGKMSFKQFFIAGVMGHSLVISLLLFALVCGGGALWLQHDEASVNDGFRSFPKSVWSTIYETLPFTRSPMITPQGELHGSIMAWVIRLLFALVLLRAVKEKFGAVFKKWQSTKSWQGRAEEHPR
jgi:TRAP transporter TAXI family solute receptor